MPHKAVVQLLGGSTTVTLEADSPKELIQQLSFYSQLPHECPICKSNLAFSYREAKGYKFWSLICSGPIRHESTFGQYKADGSLFYKPAEWEVSRRGQGDEEEEHHPTTPQPQRKPAPTQPRAPGAVTPAQLEHIGQLLKAAGMTSSHPKAKQFAVFAFGLKEMFQEWKGLEGATVQKALERLGGFLEGEGGALVYSPDTGKVKKELVRFEAAQKLANTEAQSFDQLGRSA